MNMRPILVVDDNPICLAALRRILSSEYPLVFARSGDDAMAIAHRDRPQLILLDVEMPGMDGLDVCRQLKSNASTAGIPVIFITAHSGTADETAGFDAGAVDYITKPVSPPVVRARVRTHLSLVRANLLEQSYQEALFMLGEAGHFRDSDTGMHTSRMADYATALAQACGWPEEDCAVMKLAAPLHDLGKLGIPDSILLKPGKLDAAEWEIMKTHAKIGHDILARSDAPVFKMAAKIALWHHEKWDGSGYPNGISKEEIPVEARIVALTDVFDALTMKRPYKEAWPLEKALENLRQNAGTHFDPQVVERFESISPTIRQIKQRWEGIEASAHTTGSVWKTAAVGRAS